MFPAVVLVPPKTVCLSVSSPGAAGSAACCVQSTTGPLGIQAPTAAPTAASLHEGDKGLAQGSGVPARMQIELLPEPITAFGA
ncbi:hypothetical protein M440DRAFT_1398418 [Trichoderma longibrachiatum ATCC 18648]|uniref:Uncharacterized protein n=1 Tax=Trichoderma longibrachiatum ATCC 18648 TaxID=983965 RepID=A0A2T4CC68_TRILO|nr:hypothetical protein M440DRAFT_1398418 [Trichoderma longibrachiatum ATCC 18648]